MRPLFGVEAEEERRWQAQRVTTMRPTTQIRAQRSDARMMTKSDSIAMASGGGAALVAEKERILAGRGMTCVEREREMCGRW